MSTTGSDAGAVEGPRSWVILPRREGLRSFFLEAWERRALLPFFSQRFLEKVYGRTVLGVGWLLIRALVPPVTAAFVFGRLIGVGPVGMPYLLFVLSGMMSWQLFDQSLMWATRSLEMNRRLLSRMYFPRLLLPLASVTPALVEFLVQLVFLAVAAYCLAGGGPPRLPGAAGILGAAGAVSLSLALAVGIGLWTSVWGAYYRDVRFSLRYILGVWYLLTPVLYPADRFPASLRWLLLANPMAASVEAFRWGIFGGQPPSGAHAALAAVQAAALLASGFWFFTRVESRAVERM